ncbi:hypothetical protein N0V82_010318 [Gnomoniopsis sp. IMI 355080]|nr:hypothetical protein N0V82_010318 [Gnomoniopsis sp. IMI 355080]
MSSLDTASRPKPSSSPGSTTSQSRRRRGGPGGPVPTGTGASTGASSGSGNQLNIDMSGLRISDTASVFSSDSTGTTTSSNGRRRRRRRNNNNNKNASSLLANVTTTNSNGLPPIPCKGSSGGGGGGKKPAKLAVGLNLDVELELKAKLGGELTLSMVLEEKPKPRNCPELRMPGEGEFVATELFYMRIGTLRYSRRWIDPDAVLRGQIFLTALSALVLLLAGFALGWVAARAANAGNTTTTTPMISFGSGAVYNDKYGPQPAASVSSWLDGGVGSDGNGCECDCGQVVGGTDITSLASGLRANNLSSLYN